MSGRLHSRKHKCATELTRKADIARHRVAKMGTTELMEWADTVISGMGKGFNDFRREEDEASLLEIRDHALPGLIALVDELLLRHEAATS